MCLHGGQAQAVPNPRVKVASQMSSLQASPWTVAGCPFNVSGAPVPCVTAQWITAATRVTSGGVPLLLQDSQALCVPNGTGVTGVLTQLRVKAQ